MGSALPYSFVYNIKAKPSPVKKEKMYLKRAIITMLPGGVMGYWGIFQRQQKSVGFFLTLILFPPPFRTAASASNRKLHFLMDGTLLHSVSYKNYFINNNSCVVNSV